MVVLDTATGRKLWRFQLEAVEQVSLSDAPARRGLVYWEGTNQWNPRIVFTCGGWVYALDADFGRPVQEFGTAGRVPLPTEGGRVGVVWKDNYIVLGLNGDLY